MKLVMIKYNAGNVRAVEIALNKLGVEPIISDNREELLSADRVLFPGVGNAASAMQSLRQKGLDQLIPALKQPVLGVCLGMQLMCSHSDEGDTEGLNIVPLRVKKFNNGLKVPHIGWNNIHSLKSELFRGIQESEYMYFVHSFYAETGRETIATCDYGNSFSAAIESKNFCGIQFHPELSADAGSKLLSNFLNTRS